MPHANDLDLTAKDISSLSSADAVAGFLTKLGYPTGARKELTGKSLGLTDDSADAVKHVELLAVDGEAFFRVVFVKVRSITAKIRNDLARKLGQTGSDHLIILASNFDVLEFVLLDKRTRQIQGPVGGGTVQIIPRTVTVNRKSNTRLNRRILRRLTWTEGDGLDQFEKLRSVFESAAFTTHYFQNRALFADHFLQHRLPEDAAWRDNPSNAFAETKQLMRNARKRWTGKAEQEVRDELFNPIWNLLGFKASVNKAADAGHLEPDYILKGKDGTPRSVAFVYRWDRWLDGPDPKDADTPDENPGAAVVSALAEGKASWVIVTNGKLWRLYSKDAHSRSTNFYEVDLEEALVESDETDPNEAFRFWWLFFRQEAFEPTGEEDQAKCWLDAVVQGSRDYAKRLGERLKDRIFVEIFPHLAQGFLAYRKQQGNRRKLTEEELRDTFQATLTLLYRLLFLLYAEARDLLPIGESPYLAASLKRIKEEIADHAGQAEKQVAESLKKAYNSKDCKLYDRLARLFKVMDKGDASLNVPCYNGGLFITKPDKSESREHHIARFLADNKVPDLNLALAIDRLSRDQDEKTLGLVFIDYKSLEVRHLGSIYEGLLEFKLKVAEEDLATKTEKKKEKYIPLAKAKSGRGKKTANVAVRKGEVYLSNDKAERKATGSYYTPDPIVEYIVEHTVGPVLREKLDALRGELRKAGKTFHRHVKNATSNPGLIPSGKDARTFAGEKSYAEHKDLVDKIFDFKTLDPAMGSGHFLVEAVDYITDAILDFLNRFPNNPVNFALEKTRNSILAALEDQGVKVDSNKLTDVNLLKRHVLKRCIYGVDLNPMAVELAKVSLWLDAFTLGAPLSFLDHHLRCGNSLIGANFKDLEKATEGQLFSIDYQPLLDAIRNVLFVNAMADATAAEVHESVRRYTDARKALSGYKIVFDLLVADHFIDSTGNKKRTPSPKPSSLLTHAHDLDLSTRDSFLGSLSGDEERTFVANVETLAEQADRRFFHWEIEFPEVFFGFADADHRTIKHKYTLENASPGFDAIVGNPPYIRVELLDTSVKAYLRQHYYSVLDRCDIYVAFLEMGLAAICQNSLVGFIVSSQFCNTDYGRNLRGLLAQTQALRELIDLSPLQLFDNALTYPAIVVLSSEPQEQLYILSMEHVLPNILPPRVPHERLFADHSHTGRSIPSSRIYPQNVWSPIALCSAPTTRSMPRAQCVPLGTIVNISSSMKSGKDSVLAGRIIEDNGDQIVIACQAAPAPLIVTRELWRPVIRPKDIGDNGRIASPSRVVFWPYNESGDGFNLLSESDLRAKCEVTYRHIRANRAALENRRDSGKTWREHGRMWYSLGRIGKPEDYEPPKLLSPGEFKVPRFGVSADGSLFPCARIIGVSRIGVPVAALLAVLLSDCTSVWLRANLPPKGGGFRGMSVGNLSRLPVPCLDDAIWEMLADATCEERDEIIKAQLGIS